MKIFSFLAATIFLLCSCLHKPARNEYQTDHRGFYYKLIDFDETKFVYQPGSLAQLSVSFSTLRDSVFWNSARDIADQFFIRIDSSSKSSFIQAYASRCIAGDSSILLVPTSTFFDQQFGEAVPAFAANDSVIKINLKVKSIFGPGEHEELRAETRNEEELIEQYFVTKQGLKKEVDDYGIIWCSPKPEGAGIAAGEKITIEYRGRLLNGAYLESAPQQMQFVYGSPDQVLPGLNNVIGRLKKGENAKIILPSRLAFGEEGSSDGRVPPRTPLMYDITIIQ